MSGRSEKIRKDAKRSEKFWPTLRLEGEIPDRRQHEWEDKGGRDYWEIFNMSKQSSQRVKADGFLKSEIWKGGRDHFTRVTLENLRKFMQNCSNAEKPSASVNRQQHSV